MKFLKLVHGEWVLIDNDQLVREVPDDMICMMIFFLAVVRVGSYQYRKYVPTVVRDWAIINSQKFERKTTCQSYSVTSMIRTSALCAAVLLGKIFKNIFSV